MVHFKARIYSDHIIFYQLYTICVRLIVLIFFTFIIFSPSFYTSASSIFILFSPVVFSLFYFSFFRNFNVKISSFIGKMYFAPYESKKCVQYDKMGKKQSVWECIEIWWELDEIENFLLFFCLYQLRLTHKLENTIAIDHLQWRHHLDEILPPEVLVHQWIKFDWRLSNNKLNNTIFITFQVIFV